MHDEKNEMPSPDSARPTTPSRPGGGVLRLIWDVVETVALALILFLLIRNVVQNFRIEGHSMEPNFHDGQYLVVNRLAYRFGKPARGDVIVFRYPNDPSRDFIKRVVGLPGEKVEIRMGQVFINDQPLIEPYGPAESTYSAPPIIVAQDQLYVLGDNRANSSDSHNWGPLPMSYVVGKAVLCYWPPQYWGPVRHGGT